MLTFGGQQIKVIATPGHTSGSVSFLWEDRLFTGDTLLINGCGRTDFQGGNAHILFNSIMNNIFSLPDETLIYPCHDYNGRSELAAYYSKLTSPRISLSLAVPLPADVGAWIANRGRWSNDLPACAQCHGRNGSGVGQQFPPLAGLSPAYIAKQLQAWRSGARPPGPLGLMATIASKLSAGDCQAVADYYSGHSSANPVMAGAPLQKPEN